MKESKNNRTVINIGTSLMVVILIGLSFAVIAALAISSSQNSYNLSEKLAEHTTEYYDACNLAYRQIASSGFADQAFEEEINEDQVLKVEVKNKEITSWKVENVGDWETDDTLTLIGEDGF